MWALTSCLPVRAQPAQSETASRFRAYLQARQSVEEVVFLTTPDKTGITRLLPPGFEAKQQDYPAALVSGRWFDGSSVVVCGSDFAGLRNAPRSLVLFGRYNGKAWQNNPPILMWLATEADALAVEGPIASLEQALSFGLPSLQAGSLVWSNESFAAITTKGASVAGRLDESQDGQPVRITYDVSGRDFQTVVDYRFVPGVSVDDGFPSEFTISARRSAAESLHAVVHIRLLRFALAPGVLPDEKINPEFLVSSVGRITSLLSNGVPYTKVGDRFFAAGKHPPPRTARTVRIFVLGGFMVATFGFLFFLVRHIKYKHPK